MKFRALCAAAALLSLPAFAQEDAGTAVVVPTGQPSASTDLETMKRELDATRKEMKDMREEMRAQLANQSAAQGWQEDWVPEKRKLETFVPAGYFRIRPELFHRLDLGRQSLNVPILDPSGYPLFPVAPDSQRNRTYAGVNMRFRFEPTLNVSEEVRIITQIDMLDNVVFGSTPDYAFSRNQNIGYGWDRNEFSFLSSTQSAPRSGINSLTDSVLVKRVYGEVSTPVGILRFGRMGSQWGLGMLHNDGNCLDCDYGDTVDRIQFVAEPLPGYYITPMVDINAEGPTSASYPGGGQPFDLSNGDDVHSAVLALAKRDTDQQARAKLDAGQTVFNIGVHLTYRWQKNDATDYYAAQFTQEGQTAAPVGAYVTRNAQLFMPDLWLKVERSSFRIELETAAVLGTMTNRALTAAGGTTPGQNQNLSLVQFGAVLQAEYRLLDNALSIGVEVGFASGDSAPGFGNYPRRVSKGADGNTLPGDIDGRQYNCSSTGGCSDPVIRNFRFNQDYRPDLILYREILGGVTDSIYFKPKASYRIADGFNVFGGLIYSRAIYAESTPSAQDPLRMDPNLGVEINLGARYETEDGFYGQLQWGILFPLAGLGYTGQIAGTTSTTLALDSAQVLRGSVGIRF